MIEIIIGFLCVKCGFVEMFKGGVIMDVVMVEQVKIVEDVGVVVVMVFECVLVDIWVQGGVLCMSDLDMIDSIIDVVFILVMVKVCIGYFVEVQVFQELGVDYIDELEVFLFVDYVNYIDKYDFIVLFVCGVINFGEVFCCINEGVVMICFKGEVGMGDVFEVMKYICKICGEIVVLVVLFKDEFYVVVKELQVLYEFVVEIVEIGKLFVVLFVVGGVVILVDVVMMMQFGVDGVFVGFGIFKLGNFVECVKVIVKVMMFFDDVKVIVEVLCGFGEVMVGINVSDLFVFYWFVECGWQDVGWCFCVVG